MQTQTDLNFFLDHSPHLPLGSILKHSSFSLSADSSDTQTQTDRISTAKNLPALESKVQLNRAETHTMNSGFKTLGSLFFTSNETQTAMMTFFWPIWPGTRWNLSSALLKPKRVQNYTQSPTSESRVHMGDGFTNTGPDTQLPSGPTQNLDLEDEERGQQY